MALSLSLVFTFTFNGIGTSVVCVTFPKKIVAHNSRNTPTTTTALRHHRVHPGSGHIWLEGVDCKGHESNLFECITDEWKKSPEYGWGKVSCLMSCDVCYVFCFFMRNSFMRYGFVSVFCVLYFMSSHALCIMHCVLSLSF